MSSLYIVNEPGDVALCLQLMREQDALILCGDALYALCQLPGKPARLHALTEDVQARGLLLDEAVCQHDYAGFVQLCIEFQRVITW